MEALTALHTRVSVPLVTDPGPSDQQLELILRAGLRAADHGRLRPWRFLRIEGEDRHHLGDVFVEASLQDEDQLQEEAREKLRSKPLRAPLILVVIASVTDDPNVPETEQIISAGASAQNMLNACHAMNLGAMWRTGGMAYHPLVKDRLGLTHRELIIGYLYIGQIRGRLKKLPELSTKDFIERWPGKQNCEII